MTQHQAPEVTSDDRELTSAIYRHFGFNGGTNLDLSNPVLQMVAAHRTRATQPLSLTVDEGLAEEVARIIDPYFPDDGSHVSYMAWQIAVTKARTILDRLQSLSLPAAGEQIAENANCSGDIDRSGLAQEVDDISYAGVGP
jgi:hypothetical protein